MKCPHCNQEHPEGTKFCPETGQKMPIIVGCTNKDCPNYGRSNLPTHYKFCPECGNPIVFSNDIVISQNNDSQEEDVITCPYEDIGFFHDGMAVVRKKGKYGYIDKSGAEVLACLYDFAGDFSEGLTHVHNYGEQQTFIDKKGNTVFQLDDSLDLYGDGLGFCEGLCKVGTKIKDDSEDDDSAKFGFIDRMGNLVIDCQFDHASDFHNGRALVWDDGDEENFEHRGVNFRFISKEGNVIIGSFDSATEFRDGYAAVQIETLPKRRGNYKTRIIDVDGKNAYKIDMHDSLCSYRDNNWAYNYGLHDNVFYYSYKDWIDLGDGRKHSKSYDDLNYCGNGFFDGLIAVKDRQGKWGFMNVDGDVVIECQFEDDYAPMFSDGLACVKQNDKWGYIDKSGNVVIPYQYTKAYCFSEGRAVVWKDGIPMVIDTEGNRIV